MTFSSAVPIEVIYDGFVNLSEFRQSGRLTGWVRFNRLVKVSDLWDNVSWRHDSASQRSDHFRQHPARENYDHDVRKVSFLHVQYDSTQSYFMLLEKIPIISHVIRLIHLFYLIPSYAMMCSEYCQLFERMVKLWTQTELLP